MTSISISVPIAAPRGARAAEARTRLRLTARGRRVLAVLAALPAAIALFLGMMAGGAALASSSAGLSPASFETVRVASGDSLWSIATEIAPSADPRDVVDALVRLNSIEGGVIVPGQELAIPAEYAP
ncbi:MAG: LysM peptidoglycan-binding domain-containing protein [Microbacterium sp.]|uniref:LysM peptidoglycan-binding domain-containing protein n=1 Tax=Microbacterium sp. TaxID=51671 RepID=UPI0039E61F3B